MPELPSTSSRWIQFKYGYALGISNLWNQGQYCSIITPAGIVGCGIYDLKTPAEFDQAIAIAKGTPLNPLKEPEDLLEAKIVGVTPKAASFGIFIGMTGKEAVEKMQLAPVVVTVVNEIAEVEKSISPVLIKAFDHITLVVKNLEASRKFYGDILGLRMVPRPNFSFEGLWFQIGKIQIHLILEYEGSAPAGNLLSLEKRMTRGPHFAFEVEDTAATLEVLKKLEVVIISGPKIRPDGYLQLFIADPDGHLVELCSPGK